MWHLVDEPVPMFIAGVPLRRVGGALTHRDDADARDPGVLPKRLITARKKEGGALVRSGGMIAALEALPGKNADDDTAARRKDIGEISKSGPARP